MRKLHMVGCLVVLGLAAVRAPATFINARMPVPDLVAGADVVIVGKVAKIQNKLVAALPTPKAAKKEYYQIVEVTIEKALQGSKGLTSLKVGVQCFEVFPGKRPRKLDPLVRLTEGQEACFFLKRNASGNFYEVGLDTFLGKQQALGANPNYQEDLALTRKCVKLLADADASLKSTEVKDRVLTAAMLIRKYRGPAPSLFGPQGRGKKNRKQEPITAEQSKLIFKALADADWSLANEPTPSPSHPVNLFRRLGLTARDGWTLKQKPVSPLDGKGGYKAHQEFTRAARKWLKAHGDTYRIKRLVEGKQEKTDPADEKARLEEEKREARERKEKAAEEAARREKDKGGRKSLRASAKLKLIKSLLDDGKTDIGKVRLRQLIKDFPETPAAEEAKKLLKELDNP